MRLSNFIKMICDVTLMVIVSLSLGCTQPKDTIVLQSQTDLEGDSNPDETQTDETIHNSETNSDINSIQEIYIDVCGAVINPGVYVLPPDSRVYQAIAAAGGFREDAARESLNQAGYLTDGQQLRIPTSEEALELAIAGESVGESNQEESIEQESSLININKADIRQLMTLSGVGEAKANAIIAYREEHGDFSTIEEIMNITGIKEGIFSKFKDKISVN